MGKAVEPQESLIKSNFPYVADAEQSQAVRAELERIIKGKHFRNSGRAKQFLQFIVVKKLEGHSDDLKERSIGTEVFQRPPNYSTGDDPVVRVQAGLVRRRLEQHYQEAQESSPVRIKLPLGSYAPEFKYLNTEPVEALPAEIPLVEQLVPRKRFLERKLQTGFAFAAVVILGAIVMFVKTHRTEIQKTALERFWAPVLAAQQPALLCLANGVTYRPKPELYGKYGRSHPGTFVTQTQRANVPFPMDPREGILWGDLELVPEWGITKGDLSTAVRLAAFFGKIGKPVDLRVESEYSYRDLRNSPAVLVGAFNNEWTMNLVSDLRFTFVEKNGLRIADKGSAGRLWPSTPDPLFAQQDFAIVGRLKDSKTGQFTVIIAGLTSRGTEAASEFVTNANDLETGMRAAPPDWPSKGLELVLETDVIDGVSGPPHVVASYYW
jgi:hypothetical protein